MTTQIIGTAYLTTLQGVCKVVEFVSSFIAVLLASIHFYGQVIDVFIAASVISIIISFLLFILYTTGTVADFNLPWNRFQFFFHAIWGIYYIIAAALILHYGQHYNRLIAGAVFGLIAVVAHIIDCVDNYRKDPVLRVTG